MKRFAPWLWLLVPSALSLAAASLSLPTTAKHTVVDEYHGVKVNDDYRWLEKADEKTVKQWTRDQAQYARGWLDRLPALPKIRAKLKGWAAASSPSYYGLDYRAGHLFALKFAPPKNQPLLVELPPSADLKKERVIVDPNTLDTTGGTAIDFYVPSLDGTKVAVSLSHGGSEIGEAHVFDVASAKETGDVLPRVNRPTAGGSVAWSADGKGLFYTRYPAPGEKPDADLGFFQQIYFHRLGQSPAKDEYQIGKEFPRIAEIKMMTSDDGKWVLAQVANGDGGEFAFYLRGNDAKWTEVTRFEDQVTQAAFGRQGDLYLLSKKGAPRGKLLHLALTKPELATATQVVPESAGAVTDFTATDHYLYVVSLDGGPSTVRRFDPQGKHETTVAIPPISAVGQIVALNADETLFQNQSYTQPNTWYRLSGDAKAHAVKTALESTTPVSFKDVTVVREFATSKDGTKVPMTLLMKKGTKLDGKRPTILYGYGGYSISLTPRFRASYHLWLEHGGVYVVANLRGGGEYGEEWHRAGSLTHKQNVFDDFLACAQHLIARHYTSPAKLAIEGGSNGGLLMGAALTERPDLFRAVASHVGIYDMLRVELDPNGAFNVTEFGTVKDPAQFKALYAYSPFHHVVDGKEYPAVLLTTGANDGRVNPFQSKKMAARLQATGSSREPVLLRVSFSAGHGIGSSLDEQISEQADTYAFLMDRLGVKY